MPRIPFRSEEVEGSCDTGARTRWLRNLVARLFVVLPSGMFRIAFAVPIGKSEASDRKKRKEARAAEEEGGMGGVATAQTTTTAVVTGSGRQAQESPQNQQRRTRPRRRREPGSSGAHSEALSETSFF